MPGRSFSRTWTLGEIIQVRFAFHRLWLRSWWADIATDIVEGTVEFRNGFEERLGNRWAEPLGALDVLTDRIYSLVGQAHTLRMKSGEPESLVFHVLYRLHGRAMRTVSEIKALLRTGHADGALARWRTLHEITVTMSFIAEHGETVAERYVDHLQVRNYTALVQMNKYADRIHMEPATEDEISEAKADHDRVIGLYGKSFSSDYGWAAEALDKGRPTFAQIEESVKLDHTRPYFKLASEGTHAGPHGMFFSNGMLDTGKDMIIAGPSDAGLELPATYCVISMLNATMILLDQGDPMHWVIPSQVLYGMIEQTEESFNDVAAALAAEALSPTTQDDEVA